IVPIRSPFLCLVNNQLFVLESLVGTNFHLWTATCRPWKFPSNGSNSRTNEFPLAIFLVLRESARRGTLPILARTSMMRLAVPQPLHKRSGTGRATKVEG